MVNRLEDEECKEDTNTIEQFLKEYTNTTLAERIKEKYSRYLQFQQNVIQDTKKFQQCQQQQQQLDSYDRYISNMAMNYSNLLTRCNSIYQVVDGSHSIIEIMETSLPLYNSLTLRNKYILDLYREMQDFVEQQIQNNAVQSTRDTELDYDYDQELEELIEHFMKEAIEEEDDPIKLASSPKRFSSKKVPELYHYSRKASPTRQTTVILPDLMGKSVDIDVNVEQESVSILQQARKRLKEPSDKKSKNATNQYVTTGQVSRDSNTTTNQKEKELNEEFLENEENFKVEKLLANMKQFREAIVKQVYSQNFVLEADFNDPEIFNLEPKHPNPKQTFWRRIKNLE